MTEKQSARERLRNRVRSTNVPTPTRTDKPAAKASPRKSGPATKAEAPQQETVVAPGDSSGSPRRTLKHHPGCNCKDCRHDKAQAETQEPQAKTGDVPRRSEPSSDSAGGKAKAQGVRPDSPSKPQGARKRGSVKTPPPTPNLPVAQDIPIFDPKHPGLIFDGAVKVMSTCRDCSGIMQVVYPTETVHPCCEPKPTVMESLAQGWLTCVNNGDEESAALTEEEIRKREAEPPDLAQAAETYVRWGFWVFPLMPGTKEPATKNGFEDATTRLDWVRKWWQRNPRYNIGLATGHTFDVFDVDPDAGGVPSLIENLRERKVPETHGLVATASGGLHFYLKATGKGNRAGWMPGLDYRGVGGYVVAPPSTLGYGRSWSWITVPSPQIKVLEDEEF